LQRDEGVSQLGCYEDFVILCSDAHKGNLFGGTLAAGVTGGFIVCWFLFGFIGVGIAVTIAAVVAAGNTLDVLIGILHHLGQQLGISEDVAAAGTAPSPGSVVGIIVVVGTFSCRTRRSDLLRDDITVRIQNRYRQDALVGSQPRDRVLDFLPVDELLGPVVAARRRRGCHRGCLGVRHDCGLGEQVMIICRAMSCIVLCCTLLYCSVL